MIAQISRKKLFFKKVMHTTPSEPRYFNAAELKDPRPASPGSGKAGQRPRSHAPTSSGLDQRSRSLPSVRGFNSPKELFDRIIIAPLSQCLKILIKTAG